MTSTWWCHVMFLVPKPSGNPGYVLTALIIIINIMVVVIIIIGSKSPGCWIRWGLGRVGRSGHLFLSWRRYLADGEGDVDSDMW